MPVQQSSKASSILKLVNQRLKGRTRDNYREITPTYWSIISSEEIEFRSDASLLRICQQHFSLGNSRKPGQIKINTEIERDSENVILEIVTDDMPFIFDSTTNIIYELGYSISLANHPVFWVKRNKQGVVVSVKAQEPENNDEHLFRAEAYLRFELEPGAKPRPRRSFETTIRKTLADVKSVVEGWQPMRSKAAAIRFGLEQPHLPINQQERTEVCAFLEWVEDNNFTFISYVHASLSVDKSGLPDMRPRPSTRLGLTIQASPWQNLVANKENTELLHNYLDSPSLLVITKANQIAPVHRPVYLDYIAIKDFNKAGKLTGEHRFYGLFTRSAYNSRALDIPLLATRIRVAQKRANFFPSSHNSKMLLQILETFPRDEQFQSSSDELYETAMGVLATEERNRVRAFARLDPFLRFYSLLVYIPRDRYSQKVREKIQRLVCRALHTQNVEFNITLNESALARLELIARLDTPPTAPLDIKSLESHIENVTRNWYDGLHAELFKNHSRRHGNDLYSFYGPAFTDAYIAKTRPETAARDVRELESLQNSLAPLAVRMLTDERSLDGRMQIRAYLRDRPIALAEAQPRLANLGLRLLADDQYPVTVDDAPTYWIQDFRAEPVRPLAGEIDDVAALFEDAFLHIHTGHCSDDWYNQLIITAQLSWRQTGLLRSYARYLKQIGIRFSQIYLSETLIDNSEIARLLVGLFEAYFKPNISGREQLIEEIDAQLLASLEGVASLDADRILRWFSNVIKATLRTNYYQTSVMGFDPGMYVFKLATRDIPEAPQPRPLYEIWVHSPRLEAVHLRAGKVARGGLRWSDRPEDFRTEILGLVKAQMVKNSVIVPVGAKGGFVCRQLPVGGTRAQIQEEVIACYRMFMGAMLSITDNLVNDKLVPPTQLVRRDDDDPYLVVAADKGTATFSDIANEIAVERGFWIADAFASGGSNGYDHKKMAITASGAWESVKRHFREIGKDIQRQDFTVVGVGDMAGDVFGNGMLLSKHICLLSAFNHMHIFIDPEPDAALSFKERQRLFKLKGSSWTDYNSELISRGGGLYERSAKSIKPSAQACKALDLESRSYTPDELINAILKAPVDLFWNGGIGTYVKAESETADDVGDRANDSTRVNGSELRCKVIGEGGNLGMTQLGRVEFGLRGGLCNTDFIDNSGGVDSSDREVNIKILLNPIVRQKGRLSFPQRNKLLSEMTSAVKTGVLRNNYTQSEAISSMAMHAAERIGELQELIRILERDCGLDRKLEFLPEEKELERRQASAEGLTRAEISVLLCYTKLDLYQELLESDVPEDPYLSRELVLYFPEQLHKRFAADIQQHRLRREIISTCITNSLVNRMGAAFAHRTREELGVSLGTIARAYTIARDAFEIRPLWTRIEALDNKVPANLQLQMKLAIRDLIKHTTLWLIQSGTQVNDIEATVKSLGAVAGAMTKNIASLLRGEEQKAVQSRAEEWRKAGVPAELATHMASLKAFNAVPDLSQIAGQQREAPEQVAKVYFELGDELHLGWVRQQIEGLRAENRWQALARNALRGDLYQRHAELTAKVLPLCKGKKKVSDSVDGWKNDNKDAITYLHNLVLELQTSDASDYLSLSVLLRQLGRLAA